MMGNGWVRYLLMEEIRWRTNLSEESINKIATAFMSTLETKRLAIVPTYLTDEMYDAARKNQYIDYADANSFYTEAVDEYKNRTKIPEPAEESGSFW